MGTVIVSLILAAIVSSIVFSMIRTKRSGKHVTSCGGNCSACAGHCGCMKRNVMIKDHH